MFNEKNKYHTPNNREQTSIERLFSKTHKIENMKHFTKGGRGAESNQHHSSTRTYSTLVKDPSSSEIQDSKTVISNRNVNSIISTNRLFENTRIQRRRDQDEARVLTVKIDRQQSPRYQMPKLNLIDEASHQRNIIVEPKPNNFPIIIHQWNSIKEN